MGGLGGWWVGSLEWSGAWRGWGEMHVGLVAGTGNMTSGHKHSCGKAHRHVLRFSLVVYACCAIQTMDGLTWAWQIRLDSGKGGLTSTNGGWPTSSREAAYSVDLLLRCQLESTTDAGRGSCQML